MRFYFKKKIFIFAMFAILLQVPFSYAGDMCLVMHGQEVKEKFSAQYQGKTYHFCCQACVKAFNKNPEKYLAAGN